MRLHSLAAVMAAASLGLGLAAQNPPAGSTPIRVLSSNGVRAAVEDLKGQAERAIGHPLAIEFSSTASLKQRIEAGEVFDVAIVTKESIDGLVQQGKIAASSRTGVARSGVGVGFRKGVPKPDVGSANAIKRTLLSAKSVAYTKDGASRSAIDGMLSRLGIAGEMERKTLLEPAGQAPLRVAEGKADLVLTLISEILPVPGIELAGPIPAEFQNYVAFEAGISAGSKNPTAGRALIQFLTTTPAVRVFKDKGMETSR